MNPRGKVNWNFVFALGLMFVVVAACNRGRKSSPPRPSETTAPETSAPGQLTAQALFDEYDKDKDAADRKYKGQVITVTGTIDKVKIGLSGKPYVTLKTSSLILRVQCLFQKDDESAVSELSEGQQVTFRGKVYGRIGNVLLDDCQIQ